MLNKSTITVVTLADEKNKKDTFMHKINKLWTRTELLTAMHCQKYAYALQLHIRVVDSDPFNLAGSRYWIRPSANLNDKRWKKS